MTLTEIYFLLEDIKSNTVDLVTPVNGSTHKSTKTELYEKNTDRIVGYITVDIRGVPTPDNSRARSCQTNIILDDIKINLPHGSTGIDLNLNQPSQFFASDFNGRNTSINVIYAELRCYISLIQ